MNVVFDLGKFRKAVVWKDDYPILPNESDDELKTSLQLSMPVVSHYKKIAVELKLPRHSSYYALLGVEYTPKQTSELIIKVKVSNDNDVLYSSEFKINEEIYLGIPTEYAYSIINSAKERMLESNWQYAGSITFALGAHSFVGSSEAVFSKVTNILISLLSNELSLDFSLSDASLINEELDK
ncbi:hypothetical protein J45TS6_48000 [Paenibacillus sp. J45TS6]|uniref:hypothetical protein n=1 Tax=unclassified Paenibacillus TaxID=185978 RepID=UPI001B287359|nr:hypothetical protein [Paenibacillus sp. J45TS6]GIP46341.1 hypothetical protein J45TS6_48000 [Paenibacillus sp. J45TS6]